MAKNNKKILEVYFYPEENGLIKYSASQLYFEDAEESKIIIERPDRNKNLESVSGVLEIVTSNGIVFLIFLPPLIMFLRLKALMMSLFLSLLLSSWLF